MSMEGMPSSRGRESRETKESDVQELRNKLIAIRDRVIAAYTEENPDAQVRIDDEEQEPFTVSLSPGNGGREDVGLGKALFAFSAIAGLVEEGNFAAAKKYVGNSKFEKLDDETRAEIDTILESL